MTRAAAASSCRSPADHRLAPEPATAGMRENVSGGRERRPPMAADPTSAPTGVLHEIVTDAHRHAAAALREGSPLDGVVWLSAHVAATGRAFAGSRRRRAGHRGALRRHEAATRRLEHLLRVAERRHSGDALAAGLDSDRLTASLERALSEHERAECEWL